MRGLGAERTARRAAGGTDRPTGPRRLRNPGLTQEPPDPPVLQRWHRLLEKTAPCAPSARDVVLWTGDLGCMRATRRGVRARGVGDGMLG